MIGLVFVTLALIATSAVASEPPVQPDAPPLAKPSYDTDPRMIAALRHANAVADAKCGDGAGGFVSLEVKNAARSCRRRIVTAARADAEGTIDGR